MVGVNVRKATVDDLDQLYDLVAKSSGNELRLTKSQLLRDLSSTYELDRKSIKSIEEPDAELEIDLSLAKPNCPACQALLAQVDGVSVGYLIFHYFYSPWRGRSPFLDDIFVEETHRKKGIARKLVSCLSESCKKENQSTLVFNLFGMREELVQVAQRYGCRVVRNEDSDWSVFRIDF